MNINEISLTDYKLAKIIKKHNLKLLNTDNKANYYASTNYQKELLVFFNKKENTRKIFTTITEL